MTLVFTTISDGKTILKPNGASLSRFITDPDKIINVQNLANEVTASGNFKVQWQV